MDRHPKSRAFDPTYKATKTFQDLEKEYPDNPGIRMMADRERKLSTHKPKSLEPSGTKNPAG